MSKLYSVAVVSRDTIRDIRLESILEDDEIDFGDYIHQGDFLYIFENDNSVSDKLSLNSKVFKTLNGAKRYLNKVFCLQKINLRWAFRTDRGWVQSINTEDYYICVIDITDRWDDYVDGIVASKQEEFDKIINKLKSKKSK